MAKNIVICCDGTSNQYAWDKTNVLKLYYALVQDPQRQISYYHPGLGTIGAQGALTRFQNWWTKLAGLAIGYGLENDIRDAYVFLMQTFEPGDRVFLFGFSRGAYTARSLASVLRMYGLIRKYNEPLVRYAIDMMEAMRKSANKDHPDKVVTLAAGFKASFSRDCKPWFVGVWDTVSSVGWIGNPLRLPFTADNPDIEIGRQAVAIDERRAFFRSNLWRPDPPVAGSGPKDLLQVWFPGSHCDVGGGYPEAQSGQSKFALEWMLVEAHKHGLLLDPARAHEVLGGPGSGYVAPCAAAPLHESLTWRWWPAEIVPKRHYDWKRKKDGWRMNLGRRRTMPTNARVHESAFLRPDDYWKRLPQPVVRVPDQQLNI